MQFDPVILTWLIPVPPLLSFFLIWIVTHRSKALSHAVAVGATVVSWVLSMIVLFSGLLEPEFGANVFQSSIPWLPTGETVLTMGVLVDPLTAAMLIFVPLVIFLIFFYSVGYGNFGRPHDPHDTPGNPPHNGVEPLYSRFFMFLSLFAFGMLVLVVADNLLLMFVGWEIMGLCSYLLIGFWYARNYDDPNKITPRQAAVKAFMTTRVGDVVMLLGIVYLYFASTTEKAREILGGAAGTLSFRALFYDHPEFLEYLAHEPSFVVGLSIAALTGLLLLVGTVGKSAQFPLHVWLPDAMEGPTPVSAMIHAAAMVSAGVYAMIRLFPVLAAGWHEGQAFTAPMATLATIGAFTALFAATIAFTQNDVKKVLAYSTISQLGFMLAALGIGGYVAATFHLVTHAFFKALLFLGSGSIIHGMEHGAHHTHPAERGAGGEPIDPQDMRYMGGLRTKMPVTFWTFLIGGMSLSGLPLITAGFWSKDEILLDAFLHAPAVFWVLAIAALLTAFYTTRQIVMTFFGQPRTEAAAHAGETTWTMTTPLVVLSFFAVAAGWMNIPADFPFGLGALAERLGVAHWFGHLVEGTLLPEAEAGEQAVAAFQWTPLVTSLVVALGGIFLGWLVYRSAWKKAGDRDPMQFLGPIYAFLQNKYYMDELYDAVLVRPAQWLSETLAYLWIDRGLIDGSLDAIGRAAYSLGIVFRDGFEKPVINDGADYLARFTQWAGRTFRVIQTGQVQQYLVVGVVSVLLFGLVYLVSYLRAQGLLP